MDVLQWMVAVGIRVQTADKNITIIHTTPVHQLTSLEDKSWNKSCIKKFFYESIIHNNTSYSGKVVRCESGEKSAQIKHRLKAKTALNFRFFLLKMITDGLEWWGLLRCSYQTLILTAPIHCRATISETVMQCYISPNLMKKQTHLYLKWHKGEHIFSTFKFLAEFYLLINTKLTFCSECMCESLVTQMQSLAYIS